MNPITGSVSPDKIDDLPQDSIEILPQPAEFDEAITPPQTSDADDILNEALIETFPASDPIASGGWE